MDDLEDLQASEFVTDTEDQDSLDERIDSEQHLRNQQLWASFQNAACCITKLYKDRAQPNISPWIPFQNAASNLTTLYKECIESQKKFARIGYQVGRRRQRREISKLLKKHKLAAKQLQTLNAVETAHHSNVVVDNNPNNTHSSPIIGGSTFGQQHNTNNVTSILAVNQLNLDCDESTPSFSSMQGQPILNPNQNLNSQANTQLSAVQQQQNQPNLQILLGNNEDDLLTFQQALAQPAVRVKTSLSQNRKHCSNSPGYLNNRSIEPTKSEDEKLLELNQFLSEEYHRHVGSRKRTCSSLGGNPIKRMRD